MNRLHAEACFQLGKFTDALASYEKLAPITAKSRNQAYLYVNEDWADIESKREEAHRRVEAAPLHGDQKEAHRRWWQR